MNINENNYEAFFLDYHERNLTPLQVADVLCFVEQHPELKKEFESFENFMLEDFSTIEFKNKSDLKKEITLDNKETYFIKYVEDTLNTGESDLLNNFLKQHPESIGELELFQKTKLSVDTNVVFENKNELKKSISITQETIFQDKDKKEELLIAALEGLLTEEEIVIFNQQISVDIQTKKEHAIYQKTKLVADTSIVYDNKEKLKRKHNRVTPFYYYAAAATIALLFGLFFLFNTHSVNPDLTALKAPKIIIQNAKTTEKINAEKKLENKNEIQLSKINSLKERNKKFKNRIAIQKESLVIMPNETAFIPTINKLQNIELSAIRSDSMFVQPHSVEQPVTIPNTIAQNEKQSEAIKSTEFISLSELAVEKIKEKLLDKNTIARQKKIGRLKKITGWDLAQIITSGISKLTGRSIEVKPYYNDEGAVTAYALSAGRFQISKEK